MKKNWYKSKTVWGLIIAVLAAIFEQPEVLAAGLGLTGYGFRSAMK